MAAPSMKLLAGAGGGAPAFDPETDITWHSLYWTEGSAFTALGLADADPLTSWPNETAESDISTAFTSWPTYTAVDSGHGQPAVTFSVGGIYSGAFTSAPSYAGGVSVVIVARRAAATSETWFDGIGTSNRHAIFGSSTKFAIFAGTSQLSTADGATTAQLHVAYFDGGAGNDTLAVNGTTVINANAGSQTLTGVTLGNNFANTGTQTLDGTLAFVGIYEGDITADASWADFASWVANHYGITIA